MHENAIARDFVPAIYRLYVHAIFAASLFLAGCSALGRSPVQRSGDIVVASSTSVPSSTLISDPSDTPAPTRSATAVQSSTPTEISSPTATSAETEIPTVTVTPTAAKTLPPPDGVVNVAQANCRYGPGAAYLYKFGLYQGISVQIQGRTDRGDWVYVLPLWYETGCWIKASLLDVTGDLFSVEPYYGTLPFQEYYPPPEITGLTRKGDEVWIAWSDVGMTEDKYRGYLIEAWLCRDGQLVFTPVGIDGTFVILKDEPGCSEPSKARIFTAEKHGYSKWRVIPWPPAEKHNSDADERGFSRIGD
jgi:hypothetical protein